LTNFAVSNRLQTAIAVFAYNRPSHLRKCLQSLVENHEFPEFKCILFVDGSKGEQDQALNALVHEVAQEYADTHLNIEIRHSSENLGLRRSIKSGLDEILAVFESVIVLEDDMIVSNLFIKYMKRQLILYKNHYSVGSITGYKECVFPPLYKRDTVLSKRQSCWGWATWGDRWSKVDWRKLEVDSPDYLKAQRRLSEIGADLGDIFRAQQMGIIDSWAIDFDRTAALLGWRAVHPRFALVVNSGFDGSGTHYSSEIFVTEKNPYSGYKFNMDRIATVSHLYDLFLRIKFSRFLQYFNKIKFKAILVKNHFFR
jgi:glycosyltransferase involved in cell wall biosynthesis